MNTPRLFPDYAALPTATDRKLARENNERHQLDMFTDPDPTPPHGIARTCPVCAGNHREDDCQHGTAPTFDEHRDGNRLTNEDRARIDTAARQYLTQCAHPIRPEQIDTAYRLAMHAIGCSAADLREPERDAIAHRVLTIRNEITA